MDGKTAVMYEPCNSEDLAEKMKLLDQNADLRNGIAEAGRRYLQEECNEKIMAREIEDFLIRVMEDGK